MSPFCASSDPSALKRGRNLDRGVWSTFVRLESFFGAMIIELSLKRVATAEFKCQAIAPAGDTGTNAPIGISQNGMIEFRRFGAGIGAKRSAGEFAADPKVEIIPRGVNDSGIGRDRANRPPIVDPLIKTDDGEYRILTHSHV